MAEDMVMRSVYLRPSEDAKLRQLAFDLRVTKSELIRAAISLKLRDWLASEQDELILKDVEFGRSVDADPPAVEDATEDGPTAATVETIGRARTVAEMLGFR